MYNEYVYVYSLSLKSKQQAVSLLGKEAIQEQMNTAHTDTQNRLT